MDGWPCASVFFNNLNIISTTNIATIKQLHIISIRCNVGVNLNNMNNNVPRTLLSAVGFTFSNSKNVASPSACVAHCQLPPFALCNQFTFFASNDCHCVSKILSTINNMGVSYTIFTWKGLLAAAYFPVDSTKHLRPGVCEERRLALLIQFIGQLEQYRLSNATPSGGPAAAGVYFLSLILVE